MRTEHKQVSYPFSMKECRMLAVGAAGMTLSTHPWVCANDEGDPDSVRVRNYATEAAMEAWGNDSEHEVVIDQTDGSWQVDP